MKRDNSVSPDNKLLFKYLAKAFGGHVTVNKYLHDTEPLVIDILRSDDRPVKNVISYSTIGLSDVSMKWGKGEFPTRVELVGACSKEYDNFPNILAAAAFCTMRTETLLYPGACLPNYVMEYYESTTVPHLYLTAPFLWEETLRELRLSEKTVNFLLGFGISDGEYEFLEKNGDDALEDLFEKRQIDIFDLHRRSVLK